VHALESLGRGVFRALLVLGIAAHLVVAVVAGNRLLTPWSGIGDMREYVTLARNLLAGAGFTYAHQPTALRPPLYPVFLAALMWVSPQHWPAALHILQFVVVLAIAWLCGRLAERWFGASAGRMALLIALFLPTLAYEGGEIMTESTNALLVLLFLLYLDESIRAGTMRSLVLTGFFAGLAALERFNAAALALIAIAAVFLWVPQAGIAAPAAGADPRLTSWRRWRRPLLVGAVCLVVVGPWLVRTLIVFHGQAIYSTHGGYAAVEGVLMPLGRAQGGTTLAVRQALGWTHMDIETNDPAHLRLGPEPELNHQAMQVALRLWRNAGWGVVPIFAQKLGAFWLSIDQIADTQSFSLRNRMIRGAGVVVYWMILLLAVSGWLALRRSHRAVAHVLLFYAAALTVMHLPLTMNTRLRSPLLDPLLAVLAAGGWLVLWEWVKTRGTRRQLNAGKA
jgi:hypothetical protein